MEHWIGKCRRCSCRYKLYLVPPLPVARLGEGKTVGSVSTQVPPLSWVSWGWLPHRSSERQADPPLPPLLLAGMNEEWLPDRETERLLTLPCAQLDGLGERQTAFCKGLTDHGSWLAWRGLPFPPTALGREQPSVCPCAPMNGTQQDSCCKNERKASLCCCLISTRISGLTG